MFQVRILTRLNSPYGTFEAGDIVDNLPEDVATAWIDSGIAELATLGRQPIEPDPALDEMLYTADDEPLATVVRADKTGKKSSRKRTPASHPSGHESPLLPKDD